MGNDERDSIERELLFISFSAAFVAEVWYSLPFLFLVQDVPTFSQHKDNEVSRAKEKNGN